MRFILKNRNKIKINVFSRGAAQHSTVLGPYYIVKVTVKFMKVNENIKCGEPLYLDGNEEAGCKKRQKC